MRDYDLLNHIKDNYHWPTTITAGLREGTPLPQPVQLDLIKLEHILVSIVVLGAIYGVAIMALAYEIVDNIIEIKKKRRPREDVIVKEDDIDENKDKEDAQEEDETKTRDLEGKQEKND